MAGKMEKAKGVGDVKLEDDVGRCEYLAAVLAFSWKPLLDPQ